MKLKTLLLAAGIIASVACASAQTEIGRLTYATDWGESESNSAFADFDSWASQFTVTPPNITSKAQILSGGVSLAKARRHAFAELIKTDPQKALALTVPASVRQRLPAEVVNELETRVSGIGDYSVVAVLPVKGGPPIERIQRFVHLNGQTYRAYVYGRRLGETCKNGIPLHGVVLDGVMAAHEGAIRELETNETQYPTKQIIDLRSAVEKAVTVPALVLGEMGGTLYRFATLPQMQQSEVQLEAAEAGINPSPLEAAINVMKGNGKSGTGVTPKDSPTPWTTGLKTVLIIRIDFYDLPGDPSESGDSTIYTQSYVQNLADTQVSPFYQHSSYGLTSLTNIVTTQVLRMPRTAAYYVANDVYGYQLGTDAEQKAAINYNLTNYDRVVILFSSLRSFPGAQQNVFGSANGWSNIGGQTVWVNGALYFGVLAHELGHTYGVYHGNLWQVHDGNPISRNGTDVEYGDTFDVMGENHSDTRTDFNPWFKNIFGWISDTQVQTVTVSGTYRIFAYDSDNYSAPSGERLALKIVKDSTHNYWIGCKRNFTDNPSMENGAYVFWGYNYNRQSDLLDMTTPGVNIQDAALALGAIFTDTATNITIRPVAVGGIAPNKYVDVQISFGPNPPLSPVITMQPSNQIVTLGNNTIFTITGSGNPAPRYHWQFQASGSTIWIDLSDNGTYHGSGTASLTVVQPGIAASGIQFRCIITNTSGSVTSSPPAVLSVNAPLVVTTLAGLAGTSGSANGTGTNATFNTPWGIAVDKTGNSIYVADYYWGLIRRITPSGTVTTLASYFYGPQGVAVDASESVYVADSYHQQLRMVSPAGMVSTIAGSYGARGSVDGTNGNARFNYPAGIAVDSARNIYVADTGNNMIRRVGLDATGTNWIVSTIAGSTNSGTADGTGTNAQFYSPSGIAVDSARNIYVADTGNWRIRQICLDETGTNWVVSTIAGGVYGSADGIGTNAQFSGPYGVAVANSGNLYVAENNQTIRKITPDKAGTNWVVATIAGLAYNSGSADGAGTNAQFNGPSGIAVDNATNIYIADAFNNTVRVGRYASVIIPTLQISPADNYAILSWPTPVGIFTLESVTNISMTDWTAVAPTPLLINGQNVVTNSVSGKTMFFRLRKH